ncbi:GlxA family transcriptional regulator, partial [Pseudomonas fragi]|nr:GlxA family transcriptional regulator [Pseudomonas sp. GC01]
MSNHLSTPLRRVSILAIDRVFASTLMQAKDFFHLASLRHGKQLGQGLNASFETRLVSPDGKPVTSFSDVVLPVDGALEDTDIIILPAFWDDFDTLCQRYPQILPWLRAQHARGAVLCAEANGAFWLAEAGLLDGKEATTYWRFFSTFAERFPRVHLNQDKHLTDADNLYCTGGPTSACDLYIYLIERFCGANIAQAVARDILYEVQR